MGTKFFAIVKGESSSFYRVLQKGRIQILKKEQENRERATGNRLDAVLYENENRYKSHFSKTMTDLLIIYYLLLPFINQLTFSASPK